MTIAHEIYKKTSIGESNSMRTGGSTIPVLSEFQSVVSDLEKMESDGLIEITQQHKESQTGQRFVDYVVFTRLK